MTAIVWWEIETPAPERFQEFYAALWDWTFEPAFAETELGADYWIIRAGEASLGGLRRAVSPRTRSRWPPRWPSRGHR